MMISNNNQSHANPTKESLQAGNQPIQDQIQNSSNTKEFQENTPTSYTKGHNDHNSIEMTGRITKDSIIKNMIPIIKFLRRIFLIISCGLLFYSLYCFLVEFFKIESAGDFPKGIFLYALLIFIGFIIQIRMTRKTMNKSE